MAGRGEEARIWSEPHGSRHLSILQVTSRGSLGQRKMLDAVSLKLLNCYKPQYPVSTCLLLVVNTTQAQSFFLPERRGQFHSTLLINSPCSSALWGGGVKQESKYGGNPPTLESKNCKVTLVRRCRERPRGVTTGAKINSGEGKSLVESADHWPLSSSPAVTFFWLPRTGGSAWPFQLNLICFSLRSSKKQKGKSQLTLLMNEINCFCFWEVQLIEKLKKMVLKLGTPV